MDALEMAREQLPIGAQVLYTPPDRPRDRFLVKSLPMRIDDRIMIKITGFQHAVPIDELEKDDLDD